MTLKQLKKVARRFYAARSVEELAALLRTGTHQLQLMAQYPSYNLFSLPKKDGGQRHIEAPQDDLKRVLRRLNAYLQTTYYLFKSDVAYGYIQAVKNDADRRTIFSNAKRHLACTHLLNVDLLDFFHQVKKDQILSLFKQHGAFNFEMKTAQLLSQLCSFRGRLPMGSPTSPSLSNFACLRLDKRLQQFGSKKSLIITRYVDDISISAQRPITPAQVDGVKQVIDDAGFAINPNKLRYFGPRDQKEVTGLIVTDRISLPPKMLHEVDDQTYKLAAAVQLSKRFSPYKLPDHIQKCKAEVLGKINFIGDTYGKQHANYTYRMQQLEEAMHPAEEFEQKSWLDFPYQFL